MKGINNFRNLKRNYVSALAVLSAIALNACTPRVSSDVDESASPTPSPVANATPAPTATPAASQLVISTAPAPSSVSAGSVFTTQPVITAKDAGNAVVTTYNSTITITAYSDAGCTTAVGGGVTGNSMAAVSGVSTFTALAALKSNVVSLKASDGTLSSACINPITVTPSSVSYISFTTQPAPTTVTAGSAFTTQPVITAYDAYSNILTNDSSSTVTIAGYDTNGCGGSIVASGLSGTTTITIASGVGSYAGIAATKTNVKSIKATLGPVFVCSNNIVVNPGVISSIAFTTQPAPATITAGTAFTNQPIITAYDTNSNVVTTDSASSVALSAYDTNACGGSVVASGLSGTSSITLSSGVGTYSGIAPVKTNVKAIKATLGAFTACSNNLTVNPGAIASINFSTQAAPTTLTAGASFTTQPVVTAYDVNSNVVTSDSASTVALSAYDTNACGGSVVASGLSGTTSITLSSGVGTYAGIGVLKTATKSIKATLGAFTVCSNNLTINPGAIASIIFSAQPAPAPETAGTALTTQPVISALDANSNVVTSDSASTVTLAAYNANACGGSVVASGFSGTATVTLASGVGTYSAITPLKTTIKSYKATLGAFNVCSNNVTVNPGAVASLAFTTQPSDPSTAGAAFGTQPVVTMYDANSNVVTTSSANVVMTLTSGSGTLSGTTTLAATAGVASFTNLSIDISGLKQLTATVGGVNQTSVSFTINANTASQLVITTAPTPLTTAAGTAFTTQPVITAKDVGNSVVTTYTALITFTAYSDTGCTTSVASGLSGNAIAAVSGVSTFTALTALKVGIQSLKASDGTLSSNCINTFVVNPGAAAQLVYTTNPSGSVVAGVNLATQPVVQVQDANGNLVNSGITITLSAWTSSDCTSTSGGGVLNGGSVAASSGTATFSTVNYSKAETIYLKASNGALTFACFSNIVVSAAAASKLAYGTNPSTTATAGANFGTQPVVQIQDSFGNLVNSGITINLSAFTTADCSTTPGGGTLNNASVAASAGTATFSTLNYTKAETIYIKASSGALTVACFSNTVVSPASASKLVFSTTPSTSVVAGVNLATQPVVQVQDTYNNLVTSSSASITLSAWTSADCATTPASGALGATTNPLSATSGVSTFAGVNYTKAENIYLKASSGVLTIACFSSIAVSPAAAAKLVYSTNPSGSVVAGVNLATQPVVQVQDTYNNLVNSGVTVTLTAWTTADCTTTAGLGVLSGGSVAASSGTATFSTVNYSKAETIYLKASSGALTIACFSNIVVSAAGASKLAYGTNPSTTATAGTNFGTQPVVQVQDTYGNLVNSSITILLTAYTTADCTTTLGGSTLNNNSVAASAGTATFSTLNYTKAETIYIKASSGALTIACFSNTVVSATTAAKLVYSTNPSTTGNAGVNLSTQPAVQVLDTYNNLTSSGVTVTLTAWTTSDCSTTGGGGTLNNGSVAASSGTATFSTLNYTKAETIYLKASSGALTVACFSNIAISAGADAKLVYTTAPATTGAAGVDFTTQPVVQVQDAYNNVATASSAAITLTAWSSSDCSTTPAPGGIVAISNPVTVSSGSATFSGVGYSRAATIYVKAGSGALTKACSAAITPTAVTNMMTVGKYGSGCAIIAGAVQCGGDPSNGQLGNNDSSTQYPSLTQVTGLTAGATSISNSLDSACAVVDGAVTCWGYNGNGTLGTGNTTSYSTPAPPAVSANARKVSAGGTRSMCALVKDTIQCWGYNAYGQVGDGTIVQKTSPVTVVASGATDISVGYNFTCAVVNGGVQCWGQNDHYQLGDNTTSSHNSPAYVSVLGSGSGIVGVEAGYKSAFAWNAAGKLYSWGYNNVGQLGDGATTSQTVPTAVTGYSSGVTSVASNDSATCLVKSGVVYCTGTNVWGGLQLGGAPTNTDNPSTAPNTKTFTSTASLTSGVSVIHHNPFSSNCVTMTTNALQCWGGNKVGELGDATVAHLPVAITSSVLTANISKYSMGGDNGAFNENHFCALYTDGSVKCQGRGMDGQLGHSLNGNSNTMVQVTGLTSGGTQVSAGQNINCAVVSGAAKCWGSFNVGTGDSNTHNVPVTPTGLSSGVTFISSSRTADFTCAVVSGLIYCWGDNTGNQVGVSGGGTILAPTPAATPTTGTNTFSQVATGTTHACALRSSDNTVWCWGSGTNGQLGDGSTTSSYVPVQVSGITTATQIEAGSDHTCALLSTNTVKCWGKGSNGRLGNGSNADQGTPVAVSTITGVSAIAVGSRTSCALISGAVSCWGKNYYGILGDGTFTDRNTPVSVTGMSSSIASISVYDQLCGVTSGGGLKCVGAAISGGLNNGVGIATGSISTPVLLGSAAKLVLTGPATSTHGSCSTAFTITLKDVSGNTINTTGTVVTLSEAGAGQFYSDSGCGGSTTTATITSGTATFWYKNPNVEVVGPVVTSPNLAPGYLKHSAN